MMLRIDRDDLILALTAGDELEDCEHYLDTQSGHVLYAGEGVEDLPADLRSSPRYLRIEPVALAELLRVMTGFVDGLDDPAVAAWLRKALQGDSPGPAFKAALLSFPAQRDAWLIHQHQAFEALADAWCHDHGLGGGRQASLH
jgi:hypothetical protein